MLNSGCSQMVATVNCCKVKKKKTNVAAAFNHGNTVSWLNVHGLYTTPNTIPHYTHSSEG